MGVVAQFESRLDVAVEAYTKGNHRGSCRLAFPDNVGRRRDEPRCAFATLRRLRQGARFLQRSSSICSLP